MSSIKKLANGVGWGALSTIVITLCQLLFMGVMARLLEPSDFGLVAIANVTLRFFSYFSQMGIAPALIQKQTLDNLDISAALTLSLCISGCFFVLALFFSELIDAFFAITNLGEVIKALSINFLIVGFSSVALGLMNRKGNFKSLAIIEIISYIVGYGFVGMSSAYYGFGVWSLVMAFVSQTLLTAILSYYVVRHPLSLKHTREQRKHFLNFGGRYSIVGFIEFLISNLDALIIGKLMGVTAAGYYNRALLLANLPVQQPANVLTRVLFPLMSTMGNQQVKLSLSYQLSTLMIGGYAFAVSVGIFFAADDIVMVLLGSKWLATIPILKVLSWSVPAIYLSHVASVTLNSMGQLDIKLRIQLSTFVMLAFSLFFAAKTDNIVNIAIVVVLVEWIRACVMVRVMIRLLVIPWMDIAIVMLSILTVSAIVGLSFIVFSQFIIGNLPNFIRLLIDVIAGLIGLLIGGMLIRGMLSKHPAIILLADRVPRFGRLLGV